MIFSLDPSLPWEIFDFAQTPLPLLGNFPKLYLVINYEGFPKQFNANGFIDRFIIWQLHHFWTPHRASADRQVCCSKFWVQKSISNCSSKVRVPDNILSSKLAPGKGGQEPANSVEDQLRGKKYIIGAFNGILVNNSNRDLNPFKKLKQLKEIGAKVINKLGLSCAKLMTKKAGAWILPMPASLDTLTPGWLANCDYIAKPQLTLGGGVIVA